MNELSKSASAGGAETGSSVFPPAESRGAARSEARSPRREGRGDDDTAVAGCRGLHLLPSVQAGGIDPSGTPADAVRDTALLRL